MSIEFLDWMEWTTPTFIIFIGVILMLTGMTIWDIRNPSTARKGFFGVPFTRGDRLFLSIVTFLGTFILWMAFLPDLNLIFALPVAAVLILIVIFRA
jgi:predicted small integral membrane protein